ncbi:MAG TPA: MFS transporter [Acidimicrobiia bacterium]
MRSTTATPFGKLAVTHGVSVCGDVFFTVALANSLFFSAATSDARYKVLLYLLLTLAPFALVAPFLGRLLDRSRGGRRVLMVVINVLRGVVAFVLANHINDPLLYPLALVALALSKSQGITKNALVPALVDDQSELVLANSRLTLLSVVGGVVAAPLAGGILKLAGGEWVLRSAAVVFLVAGIVAIGIPKARFVSKGETPTQKEELHQPSIVSAGTAMGFVRGVVGFMTFFVAFVLKFHKEPNTVFGLVVGASAIGNGLGALIAPVLRRRFREEWMIVGFVTIPAIILVFAARVYGVPSLALASAIVALSAAAAKLAFDSLLQRDAPDAVRGRAIARFETRFQLIWVGGGLLAVLIAPTPGFHAFDGKFGLFLMALVMLFVGFGYLGAVRHTSTRDPKDPPDALPPVTPVSQLPRLAKLRRDRGRGERVVAERTTRRD